MHCNGDLQLSMLASCWYRKSKYIYIYNITFHLYTIGWWRSVVINTLASINVASWHRARLLLGRVTACGQVNHPGPSSSRSTQPSSLCGMVNEYQLLGWVIISGDDRYGFLTAYRRAYGSSPSPWSKGQKPSAFIAWTGWTLAMTLSHDNNIIHIVLVIIGSQALSFSGPLWSVNVNVCGFVAVSATLRSNISETKGDRG